MFAVLLGLALVLAMLAVAGLRRRLGVGGDVREALVVAGLLCGGWIVVGTELLSLGRLLRFWPLLGWWGCTVAGLTWCVVRWRSELRGWLPSWRSFGLVNGTLLGLLLLLVGVTALGAVRVPPNNHDSMRYHLPRQLRWLQQGSVAHFPVQDLRQVQMPPYAEFAGLHLMILAGNDGWANLVEWLALLQTVVTVSLIARELGLSLRGQLLAALFVITVPMAYLQASSTKNDLVVSLWLCVSAWLCVRLWTVPQCNLFHLALTGVAFGLLLLTKGTGVVLGTPVFLVGVAGLAWKHRPLWWQAVLVTTGAVVLVNAGHWTRNSVAFGSPLGPTDFGVSNETHSPLAILGVAVRNVFLHLGTPSKTINDQLTEYVDRIHHGLGVDMNDPRTSFCALPFQVFYEPNQDQASAPAHVLLALLATVLIVAGSRRVGGPATWAYFALPAGCFVLFCVLLKWQPWHARLQLPIFCLLAVVLAHCCTRLLPKYVWVLSVAAVLAALTPVLLWTPARGLLARPSVLTSDRVSLLFAERPDLRRGALETAARLANLKPWVIGFQFGSDYYGWEYGMERLCLKAMGHQPTTFCLLNPLACQPRGRPPVQPDIVIGIGLNQTELVQIATGTVYGAIEQHGPFMLYRRCPTGRRPNGGDARLHYAGWDADEGLEELWCLQFPTIWPPVRWGFGPQTRLRFLSSGQPLRLLLVCQRNEDPDQVLTILLNGQTVDQLPLGPRKEFRPFELSLQPQAGANELVFAYSRWENLSPPDRRAVLFSRILLLPQPSPSTQEIRPTAVEENDGAPDR
jgi:4-amino-4-deoxy-L-arabinose transferase-like glycosyltransferase